MSGKTSAFLKLTVAMLIFGSIGIFVRYIPLESSMIAFVRAAVGVVFLLAVLGVKRSTVSLRSIRKNLVNLLVSGTAIGFNWILLFESYKYTSVAVSTLCYYMAPILVILFSPLILRERISVKKLFCVCLAVFGMVFVSGVYSGDANAMDIKGILLGLGAAVLYASVMLLNKLQRDISSFDRTIFQLAVSAVILLPYNLLTADMSKIAIDYLGVILLIVVGIVHTGLAYYLYFGSMEALPGQTIAIISYLDPVIAVIASVLILREDFSWPELAGAMMILGAAVFSELPTKRKELIR